MRRIILLAIAAIVTAMAVLGGVGPAVAAKAGGTELQPGPGEPGPGCNGLVNAAQKSGNPKVAENAIEHGCVKEDPTGIQPPPGPKAEPY